MLNFPWPQTYDKFPGMEGGYLVTGIDGSSVGWDFLHVEFTTTQRWVFYHLDTSGCESLEDYEPNLKGAKWTLIYTDEDMKIGRTEQAQQYVTGLRRVAGA